jgi:hypothetical protein
MERVEVVAGTPVMVKTRQLGPHRWCCDVFEPAGEAHPETLLLEQYGESEMEAVAMALTEVAH